MRSKSPLEVGHPAPDFKLTDEHGRCASLNDYRGQTLVVAFCPDYWDPALPLRLAQLNEVLGRLPAGFEAVGISHAGVMVDLDFGTYGCVRFPFLQDRSSNDVVSRAFGVKGQEALFVIDGAGIIRWRQIGFSGPQLTVDELIQSAGLDKRDEPHSISRRDFLVTVAAVAVALTLLPRQAKGTVQESPKGLPVALDINGSRHTLNIEPNVTLLDALRERAGLTGTKKGCDHGQCGACTVLIDGRRVNSCLLLATMQQGKRITTIEGLAHEGELHPMQEAFIKHDGLQCGYCTPGQILSAVACVHEGHASNDDQIQAWMSGNICRCGAYVGIREAIKDARAKTLKESIV